MRAWSGVVAILVGLLAGVAGAEPPPEDDPKLAVPVPAQATPPPGEAPKARARIAEAAWRAVRGRRVSIETRTGEVFGGEVIADEPDTVTLVVGREVVTVAKADAVSLRLGVDPPSSRTPAPPSLPEKPRHVGLQFGLAPGVALDLHYDWFYGFASTALIFPLASSGQIFGVTIGAGATFRLGPTTRWYIDLFGHLSPMGLQRSEFDGFSSRSAVYPYLAFGIGLGLHYTTPSGLTLGIKIPVIGYSIGDVSSQSSSTAVGTLTGYYYLASALSLPILSLGYRF